MPNVVQRGKSMTALVVELVVGWGKAILAPITRTAEPIYRH
ncbi:MAG TPA: hypothetical protein PK185_07800 [Cyclobacteriaceae bacterium]|nr:hypothetical protein [Cyclobacteriaceae bacterium]